MIIRYFHWQPQTEISNDIFGINLVGDEADTDVSLNAVLGEVENRSCLEFSLRHAERPLHHPQAVIPGDDAAGVEVGVGDVALQSVPATVFRNLVLHDGDIHVLAYLKELVVASAVDIFLGQAAAAVSLIADNQHPLSDGRKK